MDKKTFIACLIFVGLSILYVLLSLINFLTGGKWSRLVRKKITIGTLLITFSLLLGSASSLFAQQVTPGPTPTPTIPMNTPMCYTPLPPTAIPTPDMTPTCYVPPPPVTPVPPTVTPTPVMTPTCYVPLPSVTPVSPTATPTPTPTPQITPLCYTPSPPPTATPTPDPGQSATGDVDNNGIVDIVDALKVARYSIGFQVDGFDPSQADVDKSGKIDIVDALCIAQKYVGIIDEYPDNS